MINGGTMTKYRSVFLFLLFLLSLSLPAGAAQDAGQNGQGLFRLGVFAYENEDYKAAEDYLQQALSFHDSDAYVNYYLGNLYLKTEDYARAAVFLDKTLGLNEDLPDLAYNWAYVNYKLKNYPVSGQLFEKLTVSEPDNVLVHYYAGLSLYNQEKFQPALTFLDQAVRMDTPVSANADYHAALCDLHLEDMTSAGERLTRVQQTAADEDLRRAATVLLEKMRQGRGKPNRYSLTAKLGWEYDDNEALEPIDDSDLFADDEDHIFSGYLSAAYDFIQTDRFTLGAGYSHYCTLHDEIEEYDLTGSLFEVYARYRQNAYTFTVSYNPDYYWLDSESYLCRHEIKTTVSREIDALLTEFSYSHQRDNNLYDSDQDGYANEVFLRCRYNLPREIGALRAGIGYEINSAEHPDHDYKTTTTELAAVFNLGWKVYCTLCGECEFQQYDHTDTTFGKKRDDTRYTGNILLSRNIFKEILAAHVGYEYIRNKSNIDDFGQYSANYDYESNAVKFFLTVTI